MENQDEGSLSPFPCVVAKGKGFVKSTVVLDSVHKDSRPRFPSRIQIRMKDSINNSSFEEEPLSTCNWQCFDILGNLFHKECWLILSIVSMLHRKFPSVGVRKQNVVIQYCGVIMGLLESRILESEDSMN